MENSYVEIKVSFIHIVVLLVGVIIIGSFLFYLGYNAGKSSARGGITQSDTDNPPENTDDIRLPMDVSTPQSQPDKQNEPAKKEENPSISEEIKMHQLPAVDNTAQEQKKKEEKPKTTPPVESKGALWSVQVGAFADQSNAQNYAERFEKAGYFTRIDTIDRGKKKLFRVIVGRFKNKEKARAEQVKLEKMENRKFAVIPFE